MRVFFLYLIIIFLVPSLHAAIEVDETWWSGSRVANNSFTSGIALKKTKKMGIQTTFAGATGLAGLNIDLNFSEDFALSVGYGVSRGFQAINIHAKQSLGGTSFIPYFVWGYSNWHAHGRESGVYNTSPAILAAKFLDAKEKRTGVFAKNIVYPGLGIQYINLSGDWLGLGFFAEVLALVDINDFLAGPTAGIGTIYYF
ncbi:MAG: hypothetical protein A2Z20_07965 [Bdellovibrionales bacterium RBG_16_40_8]|nr:MAG: hypothetical protein A2Z20_07965 [Bdellovibrionales bacterium RBG_16_40_8]